MKRIELLSSLTKGNKCLLDIGTDHGLVIKDAIDKGYIKEAIASDIAELPLNQARKNLKNYDIKFIISDGFLNIKDDNFDVCMISGMGTFTITNILKNAPKRKGLTFFLQSNDKIYELRCWLQENNYKIIDEYIIFDKRFYIVLKVVVGNMKLTENKLYLGPYLSKKEGASKYYESCIKKIDDVINKVSSDRRYTLLKIRSIYAKEL